MAIDKNLIPKKEDPTDLRPLLNFLTQGVSPDPHVKQWTEYQQVKQVEESVNKLEFEEGTVVDGDTVLRQELSAHREYDDVGVDVRGQQVQDSSTDTDS
jgi:hypothetical protein